MSCAFQTQPSASIVEPSATPPSSLNDAKTRLFDSCSGRDVEVVRPVLALEGVGEVEGPVVGAPARAVGTDDPRVHLGDAQVGIEAVQPADRELLLVVHAAGVEAAAAVALAVVQPRARHVGLDALDQVELAGGEVEEVEPVVEREHRAAAPAQRHCADVAAERPVLDLARTRVEPPDRRLADAPAGAVDPVEAAFLDVPHGPFAEVVLALQKALDLHAASRSRSSHAWPPGVVSIRMPASAANSSIACRAPGQL